jgi:predicted component of type VI protein secretion system
MAKETVVGVEVVTDAIKEKVPGPIPLNKLIVDDYRGDVLDENNKPVDPLADRLSEDYKPPEPTHAPTLGVAFQQFKPAKLVTVPSLDKPGETKTYHVSYATMGDFDPESYEKRIPELRQLGAEEEGLTKLLGLLQTPAGRKQFQKLLEDKEFAAALGEWKAVFTDYLARIEAVLTPLTPPS